MFLFKVICVAFAALCCANAHVITPVGPHLHQVPFAAPHLDVHPLPAFHPAPLPFAAPHVDVHPAPLPFAAPHVDVHPAPLPFAAPHVDVHPLPALPAPHVHALPALPAPTVPFAAPAAVPVLPSPPLPTLALPTPVFAPALPVVDPLVLTPTYKAIPGPITKTHSVSLGYAYPHFGKYVIPPSPHVHAHSHSHLLKAAPLLKHHHHHIFA